MIGFLLFAMLQQPVPPDVALQIGLRLYQGERVTASATTGDGDTVSGSVWTDSTFCGVGSGNTSWSVSDRIRWQFTARIVQRTGSTYTIEIEWQRDGGSSGSLPKTTQQFVLQVGSPQTLDTLTPTSPNACGVTALRIEAAVVPSSLVNFAGGGAGGRGRGVGAGPAGAAGGGGGGRGRGIAGISGSTTSGTGSGARGTGGSGVNGAGASANAGSGGRGDWYLSNPRGATTALEFARMLANGTTYQWNYANAPSAAGGGSAAFGGGRGVGAGQVWTPRERLTPIPNGSYDAELWLVHTPTGGTEETQHVAVHLGSDGEAAAFPIVTVSTPNGPATVDVAVALRVMSDEKGATVLRATIVRRVEGGSGASTGATTKVVPLPASSDTLSFELPDAGLASINALADHRFSVRLKMASGKDDVR
jgi:hypothetical protein